LNRLSIPIKLNWLDRAIEINKFHATQLKDEPGWTITKTAKMLNRSVGSVAEDLLIASWLKTHEKQLKRFNSMREALAFVRSKKREMRLGD
jgi:hypothetical protein